MAMYVNAIHNIIARYKPHNLAPGGSASNSMAGFANPSNLTTVANQSDPEGLTRAVRLVEAATTSSHTITNTTYMAANQMPAFGVHTFSISALAAERTWLYLQAAAPTSYRVHFDIANGVVGTKTGAALAWMRLEENGFFRCSMVFPITSMSGFFPTIGMADVDGALSYLGDVTKGFTVSNPMIVKGIRDVPYTPQVWNMSPNVLRP